MMQVIAEQFFESCRKATNQTFQRAITDPRSGFLAAGRVESACWAACGLAGKLKLLKGLILAQNERWRRGLGMQVEREPGGNSGGKWRKGQ
jgi:hypothetical protein